jgi:type IV fimbrial biogenesis protein FimT
LHDALVALAVITVTTTIGVPALRSLLAKSQVVTAANTLVAALQLARSEAIMRNLRVVLCPSTDGQRCRDTIGHRSEWHSGYIIFVDDNGSKDRDSSETVLRYVDSPTAIRIYGAPTHDTVTYYPTGMSPTSNGTFVVCDPDSVTEPRAVVLSNTGRPHVKITTDSCRNASA